MLQVDINESWKSVTWQSGWITLLYGQNGVGKTTWLRHLAAAWSPLYYSGHTLGWVPHLTVKENIKLWSSVYPRSALWTDAPFAGHRWGDLSQGQKHYLAFVGAELSGCTLWLMDEPFAHMDIDYTKKAQSICCCHLKKGGSLVVTSHYADALIFWPYVQAFSVS